MKIKNINIEGIDITKTEEEENITANKLAQKIINDLYKRDFYNHDDIALLSLIFEYFVD